MSESIYGFEKQGRRKFPEQESENAALKEFAARLGFENSNYEEHRDTLLNFVLSYHKVISRYKELRAREMRWRILFTVLSVVLLFAIPLLILAIGAWLDDKDSVTAQVTAVLTGLLAVHRSLSSWLEKRTVIGNFWKAESDLKTKLYAFEDKWKGLATRSVAENEKTTSRLKDDFLAEVRVAIAESHSIVQDEQNKFFNAVTYPSVDLGDMLKTAGESAKRLVSNHTAPKVAQWESQRDARKEQESRIAAQKDKVVTLEVEIAQRRQFVEKKRLALQTASQEGAEALKAEIETHQAKMKDAEEELVVAKGQLAALQIAKPA